MITAQQIKTEKTAGFFRAF